MHKGTLICILKLVPTRYVHAGHQLVCTQQPLRELFDIIWIWDITGSLSNHASTNISTINTTELRGYIYKCMGNIETSQLWFRSNSTQLTNAGIATKYHTVLSKSALVWLVVLLVYNSAIVKLDGKLLSIQY